MIGLDTNVLARYYVEDAGDSEARKQRVAARRLIESGQPLMIGKTVLLELEWVLRGYYGFSQPEVAKVLRHILGLQNVTIEDREVVEQAVSNFDSGIEFADALHHASYRACESVATFDDRKFARRARKLGMTPAVTILS